ncbi:MAG TPA: phage BR0599 family protein, partial [Rhizomicrobium sp.]|nr:phage BR0599 family protein [Rhizomicrobium sp.]
IEIWRVNWADVSQRVLMRKGNLGEVKRGKTAFTAEVRGLAHILNQPVGRAFGYGCDADLGDARCTIDLTNSAFRGTGTVTAASDQRRFTASGLGAFADGWFTGGKLAWSSGANNGRAMEVKRHAVTATDVTIELWQAMSEAVAPGDAFVIAAGCDKQFATCKTKFANAANFRGFPYMPGNDAVVAYPTANAKMDGGSRYGN